MKKTKEKFVTCANANCPSKERCLRFKKWNPNCFVRFEPNYVAYSFRGCSWFVSMDTPVDEAPNDRTPDTFGT